jgi:hypothetical protein
MSDYAACGSAAPWPPRAARPAARAAETRPVSGDQARTWPRRSNLGMPNSAGATARAADACHTGWRSPVVGHQVVAAITSNIAIIPRSLCRDTWQWNTVLPPKSANGTAMRTRSPGASATTSRQAAYGSGTSLRARS